MTLNTDLSPETERGISVIQLREIARQVTSWTEWASKRRDEEGISTEPDTAIMSLPVPMWPTHGQFDNWIRALNEAADQLDTP